MLRGKLRFGSRCHWRVPDKKDTTCKDTRLFMRVGKTFAINDNCSGDNDAIGLIAEYTADLLTRSTKEYTEQHHHSFGEMYIDINTVKSP